MSQGVGLLYGQYGLVVVLLRAMREQPLSSLTYVDRLILRFVHHMMPGKSCRSVVVQPTTGIGTRA